MNRINQKKQIVLFLPPTSEDRHPENQKLPIEILSLAGLLLEKGYHVIPIDAFIKEKYVDEVISACEKALCLGISCLFGYQVYAAATVARRVKERFPELPVVLGGWFPTVKPDLFLNEGLADVVVRGQGEETFLELVESYRNGTSIEGIKGITYKKEGQIINNPNRPLVNLNDLPPIPYHLISDDIECYIRSDQDCKQLRNMLADCKGINQMDSELRILWYYSSYGCPGNCKFCCSPEVTGRRWIAKDPVKVVNEVEELVTKHSYNILYILDANFCVNEKRVKRFCEEILTRGLKIKWFATAEVHSISHYKEETLDLMAQSGCFTLLLGAETACDDTMRMLRKTIKVGETEKSVSRLVSRGIFPEVSYVVGYPDETPESIEETIDEWRTLKMKHPAIEAVVRCFIPLPGAGFYSRALQLGYKEPEFPEGYKECAKYLFWNFATTGWVNKAQIKKIYRYRLIYFRWAFDILREKPRLNLPQKILNRSALFRIKYKISVLPFEFLLYSVTGTIFHRLVPFSY